MPHTYHSAFPMSVPASVHAAVKTVAASRGVTMYAVVEESITQALPRLTDAVPLDGGEPTSRTLNLRIKASLAAALFLAAKRRAAATGEDNPRALFARIIRWCLAESLASEIAKYRASIEPPPPKRKPLAEPIPLTVPAGWYKWMADARDGDLASMTGFVREAVDAQLIAVRDTPNLRTQQAALAQRKDRCTSLGVRLTQEQAARVSEAAEHRSVPKTFILRMCIARHIASSMRQQAQHSSTPAKEQPCA